MTITPEKLDEIEQGLAAVTAGPWQADDYEDGSSSVHARDIYICPIASDVTEKADAAHIARCDPQTISELVRLARIGLETEAMFRDFLVGGRRSSCAGAVRTRHGHDGYYRNLGSARSPTADELDRVMIKERAL